MLKSIIKSIVEARGYKCIKDPHIVNEVADYRAYEECIPSKFIIKTIIQEGYADTLCSHIENGSYSDSIAERIVEDLFSKFGFRKDIAILVVNSLLYALNLSELPYANAEVPSDDKANKHIIFSGISLSHSINEIKDHLLKKGFANAKVRPYQIKMIGTFCGINDVKLYINGSPLGVTKNIALQFNDIAPSLNFNWGNELFELIHKKYGEPSSAVDPLDTIGHTYDYFCKNILEYSEMMKHYKDIFKYKWQVEGGEIELCWMGDSLTLNYKDTVNINLADQHQKQFNMESI